MNVSIDYERAPPLYSLPEKAKTQKEKEKPLDSRLKISGMTEGVDFLNASIITLFVTPECFYQGSTVLKTKEKAKAWIPD